MKILITAPSLDEARNVSGISTIVRQIIEHGADEYVHFQAGREDGEKPDAPWLARQAVLPARMLASVIKNRVDLVHINTALTDLSIARDAALTFAAGFARRPVVLSIHGGKYLMNEFDKPWLANIAERMLRRAKVIVVYSQIEKDQVIRRWPKLDVRLLPNAVPFKELPTAARNNDLPVVTFFGRMHESKGLHEIVEASEILAGNGFRFDFRAYGEGPLREFFVSEMSRVLGHRFVYGGVVKGDDKWNILGESDIFVLPSRYGEGLPMAMLEAMAAGCVVIAGDVASVTSVLRDGRNGYVVKPYDGPGLASKMKVLLSDKYGWTEVRENAAATIRDNFQIRGYIEKLEEIYRDAAK